MNLSNGNNEIEFGGPATYRIVVKGELGQEWSDRLARSGHHDHPAARGNRPTLPWSDPSATRPSSTASSKPSTVCICRS